MPIGVPVLIFVSLLQQLRIYTILGHLHSNLTNCSIVVLKKIFKQFLYIFTMFNFKPALMGSRSHIIF